jgi:hypothetical protein
VYQQSSRWRSTRRQVLRSVGIIVAIALLISIFGGYYFGWEWTGLVKDANFPMRTLWDWMKLLIIPVAIAGGTIWFNQREQDRQQKQTRHSAMVEALQGEGKGSVAHVAVQVREDGLPDNKQRRVQLLAALSLAMLFQHADRTRALVFSVLMDAYAKGYGKEVLDALSRINDDFMRYKNHVQPVPAFKADIDKHIEKLRALEKALRSCNGQKYKEWLQDKGGSGENGANGGPS